MMNKHSPQSSPVSTAMDIKLTNHGQGLFSIRISAEGDNRLSPSLIQQLINSLDEVQQNPAVKVLMLTGKQDHFLCGDQAEHHAAIAQNLYKRISTFAYPTIAVMQGNASGAGFLLAALCDFMVISQTADYHYTSSQAGLFPSAAEEQLFIERFGQLQANDFLYHNPSGLSGQQLQQKGWSCAILPAAEVEVYADKLAAKLVNKSQHSLRLLKQHLNRHLLQRTQDLAIVTAQTLTPQTQTIKLKSSKYLRLTTHDKNVLHINIRQSKKTDALAALVNDLRAIFTQIGTADSHYRTIVLSSEHSGFLPEVNPPIDTVLDLQRLLLDAPLPMISVLDTGASGLAWCLNQCCDATLYNEQSHYSGSGLLQVGELAKVALLLFGYRLGHLGKDILLTGADYSGLELQQKLGKTLPVAAQAQTLSMALTLAASWAAFPQATLIAWKQQLKQRLQTNLMHLPDWPIPTSTASTDSLPATPTLVELHSTVVTATVHPDAVLVVKMQDEEAKNLFSEAILQGLQEVFTHIATTTTYKAIVLTGYDKYFASGGTKDHLLAIQAGQAKFTDSNIYQLALSCPVPVIAAMQGHGIGAGLAMGLFADFIIFSEESKYLSPYMGYGFTPGAGATCVVPTKLGYDLGRDTLFTSQEYSGSELQAKGMCLPVYPRTQVVEVALALGKQLAKNSRDSLIAAKQQLTYTLYKALEDTYALELTMHEQTFVGQTQTLAQIQGQFNEIEQQMTVDSRADQHTGIATTASPQQTVSAAISDTDKLAAVTAGIQALLANELHLEEHEIDENTQFIDLGLDSITGVTWIRKINEKYQTSIKAAIVYTYPTLAKLSQHVTEQAMKQDGLFAHTDDSIASLPMPDISDDHNRLAVVTAGIKTLLANELHLEEHEIDENTQFIDLGLDSITGVTWIRKINEKYQTSIKAAIVYTYPTLAKLSQHVKQQALQQGIFANQSTPATPQEKALAVFDEPQRKPSFNVDSSLPVKDLVSWRKQKSVNINIDAPAVQQTPPLVSTSSPQAIAVIGMAGQFPQANNVQEFWQNIAQGKNCITEVPQHRWDINHYFHAGEIIAGKTNCKWMGVLDEYDLFDPLFFNISPTEAQSMDPQQRLFLQVCWQCIENASYNPRSLAGSQCGVFVGCANGDYHDLSQQTKLSAYGFMGSVSSILAARISYTLDLQGPCLSIDTACSSSLVAIANASDSLVSGVSDLAIAGGVSVMSGPTMHIMTSQAGMLSTDGKCFTFDQKANGFVPGEGVGAVMLKRLADAERDQDIIQAVIQGWGINQDGLTNGITAPNPESQARLQRSVYDKYNINPANIQLIEAHGTGTKLGDPIEVEGLKAAFKHYTEEKTYCALGSVKSNIGHCLMAAGISGFIKVVLALQHKQLPPTINFDQLNEHIDLTDSPFYINNHLQDWSLQDMDKRQAAMSSFGFSGTNAHIVIAEYQAPTNAKPPVTAITENGKVIVPLSAKTAEQLKQKCQDLYQFLHNGKQSINFIDMVYTLQVGREAMQERLGFMVHSTEQLLEKLQAYLQGQHNIPDLYYGQVQLNKEAMSLVGQDDEIKSAIINKWISNQKLSKLLELWVKGLNIDWDMLYAENTPTRISLPVYPFAKERYWIEEQAQPQSGTAGKYLHPLVHTNISTLSAQQFSSTFTGEETFLTDYKIQGQTILPAIACLEMARVALMQSMPTQQNIDTLELRNIVWGQPIVVTKPVQVTIAVSANHEQEHNNATIDYEIYSNKASKTEKTESNIIHCQGQASLSAKPAPARLDVATIKSEMNQGEIPSSAIYSRMKLNYGPSYQTITNIYWGKQQLLAQLCMPSVVSNTDNDDWLSPSLIDGIIQSGILLLAGMNHHIDKPLFPFALESFDLLSACPEKVFVWTRYTSKQQSKHHLNKLDVDVCDQAGNVYIQIKGLCLQQASIDFIELDDDRMSHDPIPAETQEPSQPLFFEEYWQAQSSNLLSLPVTENKPILIFADAEFQKQLTSDNKADQLNPAVYVFQSSYYQKMSDTNYCARFNNIADIEATVKQVNADFQKPLTLVYMWARGQQQTGIHALFNLFKAVKSAGTTISDVLLIGHYNTLQLNTCWDYSWVGFQRSLKLSLPELRISLLYTDVSSPTAQQLLTALQYGGVNWYQTEQRYTLSFRAQQLNQHEQKPIIIKQNGAYLITGGCGVLGLKFAHYLAEKYQAKLVLLGRRPLSASIQQHLDTLKQAGAVAVYYNAVDISDKKALNTCLQKIPFAISGVIHAAGVESSQAFHEKSVADINCVLQPKTTGTLLLDENLQLMAKKSNNKALDFVCYFSSSAALLGDFGACDYAIANRFQIAYAHYRQQNQHSNTVVINWPLWQQGGMGMADFEQTAYYLKRTGQEALQTELGVQLWHELIHSQHLQTLVMFGKPTQVQQFLQRSYAAKQLEHKTATVVNTILSGKGWKPQYQDLSIKACITSDLTELIAVQLNIAQNRLNKTINLTEYGFDSIGLAAFAKQLSAYFSLDITPDIFFSHTSIDQLATCFTEEHQQHMQTFYSQTQADNIPVAQNTATQLNNIQPMPRQRFIQSAASIKPVLTSNSQQEPIAIIGLSGRFPQAANVDALWDLLAESSSGMTEIPESRWNWRNYFTVAGAANNQISTNQGGFIDGVAEFDALFFDISPREAEELDPCVRLLLTEAYKAIEDASLSPGALKGSKVGVFVGMEESQYSQIMGDQGVTTAGNAMISSRISYFFDFHGPTIAINTACSSGLVALHQAVMSLRQQECEAALVASAALNLLPTSYIKMSQAGMLSEDGRCHSFGKNANGIGVGEAVTVLMLKPLSAAVANGDSIYASIKASGINFDGKTNGVTAPNGKMQEQLIESIYNDYAINVSDIAHVVAHGTGTKLGDPVEINALNNVFKKYRRQQANAEDSHTDQAAKCAITSCKSNLGHTMAASGLVSLISLLKGMQQHKIPASLYCEDENDYINWQDSHCYINKFTKSWPAQNGKPRMGAVSSFGRSGTNAHIVVEEYLSPSTSASESVVARQDNTSVIIPLSARTVKQLQIKAQDLLNFIRQAPDTQNNPSGLIDLIAIAYTLQVGREAMAERLALVVNSVEQLAEKLQAYIRGEQSVKALFQANVEQTGITLIDQDDDMHELIGKWISAKKLSKLADLWVTGYELDWQLLYDTVKTKRIRLPVYPFAKDRYWLDNNVAKQDSASRLSLVGQLKTVKDLEIIDDIINKVDDDLIEINDAVKRLKKVV